MTVRYSRRFRKQFQKLPVKTQLQFERRFNLFLADPRHPMLNIHALSGKYDQSLSMSVSGDVRAIFERQKDRAEILLLAIGTHSQLY
ncbi:hypothetical protein F4X86_01775 [Candidatus Saccharibacteria bacterium]|nr:hypothetical protein [Candidatus Saccharibacteria bacterium]